MKNAALLSVLALLLMGNVALQTTPTTPTDIGTAIQNLGQFGVLLYLIFRADKRTDEQVKAWREERKYLIGLIVGEKPGEVT